MIKNWQDGFEIINNVFSEKEIVKLISAVEELNIPMHRGGIRNLEKKSEGINKFCQAESIVAMASQFIESKFGVVINFFSCKIRILIFYGGQIAFRYIYSNK